MGNLGATELIIIAVVIILLFGAKKLPDMARSLGRSAKIFKAETKGLRDGEEAADDDKAVPAQPQVQQQLPPAQPAQQVQQPQLQPAQQAQQPQFQQAQQPQFQPLQQAQQPQVQQQPQVAPPIEQTSQNKATNNN